MQEKMSFINKVTAIIKDEHGNITHVQEGYNTITKGDPDSQHNGLIKALECLFGIGTYYEQDNPVNKMQLGTGTPGYGGLGTPITSPDTKRAFDTKAGTDWGTSYTTPKVTLTCVWGASYGALSGIIEAGLMADNATETALYAYKTFTPALSKTAGGELTLIWEVQIG